MHGHKIFTSSQHLLVAVKSIKILINKSFFKVACEYTLWSVTHMHRQRRICVSFFVCVTLAHFGATHMRRRRRICVAKNNLNFGNISKS